MYVGVTHQTMAPSRQQIKEDNTHGLKDDPVEHSCSMMDVDITISYINVALESRTFAFLTRITPQQTQHIHRKELDNARPEKFSNEPVDVTVSISLRTKNAASQTQRNCSLRRVIHHTERCLLGSTGHLERHLDEKHRSRMATKESEKRPHRRIDGATNDNPWS